jgi:hypothetical protein
MNPIEAALRQPCSNAFRTRSAKGSFCNHFHRAVMPCPGLTASEVVAPTGSDRVSYPKHTTGDLK